MSTPTRSRSARPWRVAATSEGAAQPRRTAPGGPEILTERLRLRLFEPADLDVWHARIFTDPEVMRFLPSGVPGTRERTRTVLDAFIDHWERHGFGVWAVVDRETEALIGHCGLRYLEDTPEVELLYGLGRRFWGRGLATEAARASLGYGFEQAGLSRIVALAKPENAVSRRVMEKLGMTFEGEARHFGLVAVQYAISRDEFRSTHSG